MERTKTLAHGALLLALLFALALSFGGIWSFGMWDPWELTVADAARPGGNQLNIPPLGPWLVKSGFGAFRAIREWTGRFPIALAAFLSVLVSTLAVRRLISNRAAIYLALIATTSPIFLLGARPMFGAGPVMLGQAMFFFGGVLAWNNWANDSSKTLSQVGSLALVLAGLVLSIGGGGVLVGLLPPLLATLVFVFVLETSSSNKTTQMHWIRWALLALAIIVATQTGFESMADRDGYSLWLGGAPRGGNPPSYDGWIEKIFHSFAPWSALLPLAVGAAFARTLSSSEATNNEEASAHSQASISLSLRDALAVALGAWALFGFVAHTIHSSRYGNLPFVPVMALAGSVALWLERIDQEREVSWGAALVVLLLSALLLRDYSLYPASPANALALDSFTVPAEFKPTKYWAAFLLAFGGLFALGFAAKGTQVASSVKTVFSFRPLFDFAKEQWNLGLGFRLWTLAASVLLGMTSFGIAAYAQFKMQTRLNRYAAIAFLVVFIVGWVSALVLTIAPETWTRKLSRRTMLSVVLASIGAIALGLFVAGAVEVSSLVANIGLALAIIIPALVVAYLGLRAAFFAFEKLGSKSTWPGIAAACALGLWICFGFVPSLSAHFSPRAVYDSFNRLAQAGEKLGEYHVSGRAAAYYAHGEVEDLENEEQVLRFLSQPERVWLVFRSDDLGSLNRAYRKRSNDHLFVANTENLQVLLATNRPLPGQANLNYLKDVVLDSAPATMQHAVGANLDRRAELVGYDLLDGNGNPIANDTVGPGQQFTVKWYWKCLAPLPSGYQVFLHVDAFGQRLNGDHEPAAGKYPIRLWEAGDVVVDEQTLRVPPNFQAGDYTFFIGMWLGETRLTVVEGPHDEVNRVRAGVLKVR